MNSVQFTVSWPVQGVAYFRAHERELVLSDVYWRWILDEVNRMAEQDQTQVEFVRIIENGFCDPNNLLETVPVTDEFVHLLERVSAANAPSFERLIPDDGIRVPLAEEVLSELVVLVREAAACGAMDIEIK